jgi:hypothetical protein
MGAHIVRLDKPKDSPKGTHGWQVRVGERTGYHSKLFSDGVHGGREQALAAAQEYLEQYKAEHPESVGLSAENMFPHGFDEGTLKSSNTSGIRGVFRTHNYDRWDAEKKKKLYYWGASYTIDKYGRRHLNRHKRFDIHIYGEEEARRRAIEFRLMWEEAAREGVEAVQAFFEAYEEGWLGND